MPRMYPSVRMLKSAALTIAAIILCLKLAATNEKVITERKVNALPSDSILLVRDTGFQQHQADIENTWLSRNVVSVFLDESSGTYIRSAFIAKVHVQYTMKDYSFNTSAVVTDSFTLVYTDSGALPVRDYRVFPDIYESKVRITKVSSNVSWDVRPLISISNEISVTRSYKWAVCSIYVDTLGNAAMPGQNTSANTFDELPVGWSLVLGADEYDLEWAWLDSTAYSIDPAVIFRNNTSRVTVRANEYRIPLLYDGRGRVYYRVRPVKKLPSGQRVEGGWNIGAVRSFEFWGFQRRLNWQSTTSYAEEGKRKAVVSYFDGTLRQRQTVTKDNSNGSVVNGELENHTVVAETFYDYQGRAAVQVLPSPSLKTILAYAQGFNRSSINNAEYDKDNYDKLLPGEGACGKQAVAMSFADSGAAHYYSASSKFLTVDAGKAYAKYIPDAEGYPFTQTEYSLDNTGRIVRQGGVGSQHQLGRHDTRYYYGKPSQAELDLLFGTEAGNYSHYFKNMVRDANGQYSVSYTDMRGRTIATALSGSLPDSVGMDTLASNKNFTVTEPILNAQGQVIDGFSIINTTGLTVPVTGVYKVDYQLTPQALGIKDCKNINICYDCLYDLNIKIVSDCGDVSLDTVFIKVKVDTSTNVSGVDTACNSQAFSYSVSKTLTEGAYMLTKRLTIRQESLDLYRDSIFIARNTCRDYNSFLQEEIDSVLSRISCSNTCEECNTSLGTWDGFKTKYRQMMGLTEAQWPAYESGALKQYNDAKKACNSLCASDSSIPDNLTLREEMLSDLTPDAGQYAVDSSSIYRRFTIFGTLPASGGLKNYQDATLVYLDADGRPDTVVNSNGEFVTPNKLSKQEFVDLFKPSWAEVLLVKHPEKCKLDSVMKWEASYRFDEMMKNTETYAEAAAKGLFNPPSTSNDPTLNSNLIGTTFKTDFVSKLKLYPFDPTNAGNKTSIWNLADRSIRCQGAPSTCMTAAGYNNKQDSVFRLTGLCDADKDAVWRTFRSLYLQIKASLIYARVSTCTTYNYPSPYMTRFPHPDTTGRGPTNKLTDTARTRLNQEAIDSAVAQTCRGYVDQWAENLQLCRYTETQWSVLKDILVTICQKGGDIEHITGSATLKPGQSYSYATSFVDAVARFNADSGITAAKIDCNGYLITTPPPYNAPITALAGGVVVNKPVDTSCVCVNLNKYFNEKQAAGQTGVTLGTYLRNTYYVSITDGAVDSLRALCASSDTSCKYLAKPVTIPPLLSSCGIVAPPCINCLKMDTLYKQFTLTEFPGSIPSLLTNDSARQAVNLTFRRFMNYKTGFGYNDADYLQFMANCGFAVSDSVSCDSLEQIRENYDCYFASLADSNVNKAQCGSSQWSYFVQVPWQWSSVPYVRTVSPTITSQVSGGVFSFPTSYDTTLAQNWVGISSQRSFCFDNQFATEFRVKNPGGLNHGNYPQTISSIDWEPAFYTFIIIHSPIPSLYVAGSFKAGLGISISLPAFQGQLNDWFTIKTVVTTDSVRFYINGTRVYGGKRDAGIYPDIPENDIGVSLDFGYGKKVDWMKLYDASGSLIMTEDFTTNPQRARPDPASLCPRPTCDSLWVPYFNSVRGTNWTAAEIADEYIRKCGRFLDACTKGFDQLLCGRSKPLFPEAVFPPDSPCDDTLDIAASKAKMRYEAYTDSLKNTFDSLYMQKCLGAASLEKMTLTRPSNEYHYTLYYYDQAGNLIKTVPPKAVDLFRDSIRTKLGGASGDTFAKGLDSLQKQVAAARAANQAKPFGYRLATEYRYNSLNQVTAQRTPDAGQSNFWYDILGRLVVSQNAKQAVVVSSTKEYSYTLYDYLGRIMEVGLRKHTSSSTLTQAITRNNTSLLSWINTGATSSTNGRQSITRTIYDLPRDFTGTGLNGNWFLQRNLRNRVSYSQVIDLDNTTLSSLNKTSLSTTYRAATFYTYDVHGNVVKLLQHYNNGVMKTSGGGANQFKLVRYSYDLISGKVNEVAYQPSYYDNSTNTNINYPDRFFHQYEYDAENRLVAVYTSRDSVYWEKDARYDYYRHGPLARAEIGHAKLQGLDYAYTLQGWLKGVNSTRLLTEDDMGKDGNSAPTAGGNNQFARDEFGFGLYYYMNDYKRIGTSTVSPFAFVGPVSGLSDAGAYNPLYNGNIMAMITNIAQLRAPLASYKTNTDGVTTYRYDQLNRLKKVFNYPVVNQVTNSISWAINAGVTTAPAETFEYDANGNIVSATRFGLRDSSLTATSVVGMDSLKYNYVDTLNNRLTSVKDLYSNTVNSWFTGDIDNNQSANNYDYDAIGNLTQDAVEGIGAGGITWNVYGKILSVTKTVSGVTTAINYTYDAAGNRISKAVQVGSGNVVTTWYVRDAQGNILGTYVKNDASINSGNLSLIEQNLYGSSRLGFSRNIVNVESVATGTNLPILIGGVPHTGKLLNFSRGKKLFELSNHLGNVMVVLSDWKKGVRNSSDTTKVLYYKGEVVSATDYYAFGMPIPFRIYNNDKYRYGFNGKENDNEVKGTGNSLDYGARVYDPRVGRFLSMDALHAKHADMTPYHNATNNPVNRVDQDGNDDIHFHYLNYTVMVPNGNGGYRPQGKTITWATVVRNNMPNTFSVHRESITLNQDGKGQSTYTHRVIPFYPDASSPKAKTGITHSTFFGIIDRADDDYTALLKTLEDFPEVANSYNDIGTPAVARNQRDANYNFMSRAFRDSKARAANEEQQRQVNNLMVGVITVAASEILVGRLLAGTLTSPGKLEIGEGVFASSELDAAQYMANLGNDVTLRLPQGTRAAGGTSDLLVNGVQYDVYTPVTDNVNRIISKMANKNSQAKGIVLDLRHTNVTSEQLGNALERIQNAGATNIQQLVIMPK
jgi:RHS repeat-associated protein